jgi:hypothetical protein
MDLDAIAHTNRPQRHASTGGSRFESVREEVVEDLLEMTRASKGSERRLMLSDRGQRFAPQSHLTLFGKGAPRIHTVA